MRLQYTLPLSLLILASPFARAELQDVTVTLFPAIPAVTEIAANSSVLGLVKEIRTGSESIVWALNAKRAKTAPSTSTGLDYDFYIDITSYPAKNSQVLSYFTGAPLTQVAEARCNVEGVTSAVCQVTSVANATGTEVVGMDNLQTTEVTYSAAQMTFIPVVFHDVPLMQGEPSGGVREISLLLALPGVVVSLVSVAVMLL